MTFRVGDLVRFEALPAFVARLPPESQRAFALCLGRVYAVAALTIDGLCVLDVSHDVDPVLGGFMNDLRLEPEHLVKVEPLADGPWQQLSAWYEADQPIAGKLAGATRDGYIVELPGGIVAELLANDLEQHGRALRLPADLGRALSVRLIMLNRRKRVVRVSWPKGWD